MASKFGRIFATMVEQCKPNLGLSYVKTHFYLNSASRLICSSTPRFQTQEQHQQQDDIKGQKTPIQEVKIEHQSEQLASDEDKDDDGDADDYNIHVNENTGEIGGPRGPEPTRYGDWERNGRCSDF